MTSVEVCVGHELPGSGVLDVDAVALRRIADQRRGAKREAHGVRHETGHEMVVKLVGTVGVLSPLIERLMSPSVDASSAEGIEEEDAASEDSNRPHTNATR